MIEVTADNRTNTLPVVATVAFSCLLASTQSTATARLPFVWGSVAAVYFFSALPASLLLAAWLSNRLSRSAALLLGLTGILTGMLVMLGQDLPALIPAGWLPRTSLALWVATSSLLGCHALLSKTGDVQRLEMPGGPLPWVTRLVFAALVPALYLDSRCAYDGQRLTDLLGQYRLGAAHDIAERLAAISPRRQVNGQAVSQVAADLRAAVAEIETQVVVPLAGSSTVADRLERARQWAILGRLGETERILAPLVQPGDRNAEACNLLGLAYEGQEQWLDGRYWYQEAYQLLSQAASPQAAGDLLQAVMGIAYAERKLGNYREAEVAYQRCLELEPSAAMHYLLAQFYDDAQQATKAHQHAAQAMQMDPARYQAVGSALIAQLESNHFGCLSVFWRRSVAAALPPQDARASE